VIKLNFWGAAQTVTGSQHLLTAGGEQVLLDCGFFQGKRDEAALINRKLPFDARRIDAMVLSHAHIDHSGNVPNLVKSGFEGSIFCTHATRDLAAVMLRDSGAIQEEDAFFLNRRNKGGPRVEPIYTVDDADHALRQFASFNYDRWFSATPNVRVRFGDAGHMLGSAWVLCEITTEGRTVRLCFSGDLGRRNLPILRDPEPMPEADYLIIESTYGDKDHAPITSVDADLADAIRDAARRGGKVIIPAFAVGRSQEIVYRLNALINDGRLPDIPVYVDSPLAVNVTEAFRTHVECYDDEIKATLRRDPDGSAFGFKRLKYVRQVEDSKAINALEGPAVIISASGMAENGRILHHLRHNIEDPRALVLFVSYQGPNTLGRKILDGAAYVRILGDEFKVRAEMRRIDAFSGHADRSDILRWTRPHLKNLKGIFLVHGEREPMHALTDALEQAGARNVNMPARGEGFTL
jgi:metallo-beta-lactamase family protein